MVQRTVILVTQQVQCTFLAALTTGALHHRCRFAVLITGTVYLRRLSSAAAQLLVIFSYRIEGNFGGEKL